MTTETLLLSAVASGEDNWTLSVGSSKVAACQTPDDDASSYISASTAVRQRFSLSDPTLIGSGDVINSVTLRVRTQRGTTPAGSTRGFIYLGGVYANGTTLAGTAGFTSQSDVFTEKPGGGSWTLTDLQNLEAGIENTIGGRTMRCTTVEIIVDFSSAVNYEFSAVGVGTSNPNVSAAGLAQDHAMGSVGIGTNSPGVSQPTAQQDHDLRTDYVSTGSPTVSVPTWIVSDEPIDYSFTTVSIATGSPTVGAAEMVQDHDLRVDHVATGAPTVGRPELEEGTPDPIEFEPLGVSTGAPTLSAGDISQNHVIYTIGIHTDYPYLSLPSLGDLLEDEATMAAYKTFPDWGVVKGQMPSPDIDNSELAARLKATSLRRSGRTLYTEAFETNPLTSWGWNGAGPAPTLNTHISYTGIGSMEVGWTWKTLPYFGNSKIGIEYFYFIEDVSTVYELEFGLMDGAGMHFRKGRLRVRALSVEIFDGLKSVYETIFTDGVMQAWNNIKLVIDPANGVYSRLHLNEKNAQLIDFHLDITGAVSPSLGTLKVLFDNRYTPACYVDDLTVTIDEY